MDEKFYQELIKKTDAIVKQLGCKDIDEALAKLGEIKE